MVILACDCLYLTFMLSVGHLSSCPSVHCPFINIYSTWHEFLQWKLAQLLGIHRISGSGLPHIQPFFKYVVPVPVASYRIVYLFIALSSSRHVWQAMFVNKKHWTYSTHIVSLSLISVHVCGDLSLCACKVTLNYLHIIRCRDTVTENLGNEL